MKGIIRVEGGRRGQKSKIRLLQAKEGIVKEERKTRGETKIFMGKTVIIWQEEPLSRALD